MYDTNAGDVQGLLDEIHPDMGVPSLLLFHAFISLNSFCLGWFSRNIGYGHVYRANHIVSQIETTYTVVAALIAIDAPMQTTWHLQNCINGGATIDEARAVRKISMDVAQRCGIKWESGVPEL